MKFCKDCGKKLSERESKLVNTWFLVDGKCIKLNLCSKCREKYEECFPSLREVFNWIDKVMEEK